MTDSFFTLPLLKVHSETQFNLLWNKTIKPLLTPPLKRVEIRVECQDKSWHHLLTCNLLQSTSHLPVRAATYSALLEFQSYYSALTPSLLAFYVH